MKLFISYSRKDREIAEKLCEALKNDKIDFWIDQSNIDPGDSFVNKMADGIADAEYFLLVMTRNSLSSKPVNYEVLTAVSSHIEKGTKIIPLVFEDVITPNHLKQFNHIDFREEFHTGYVKLISILKKRDHSIAQSDIKEIGNKEVKPSKFMKSLSEKWKFDYNGKKRDIMLVMGIFLESVSEVVKGNNEEVNFNKIAQKDFKSAITEKLYAKLSKSSLLHEQIHGNLAELPEVLKNTITERSFPFDKELFLSGKNLHEFLWCIVNPNDYARHNFGYDSYALIFFEMIPNLVISAIKDFALKCLKDIEFEDSQEFLSYLRKNYSFINDDSKEITLDILHEWFIEVNTFKRLVLYERTHGLYPNIIKNEAEMRRSDPFLFFAAHDAFPDPEPGNLYFL